MEIQYNYNDEKVVLTKTYLKQLLLYDKKCGYYASPEMNDFLYLHYKYFDKIQNLEQFTGLKQLFLEGNALSKIEGLESLQTLKCLYLQENCISVIENLSLKNLLRLNLSDNFISKVQGLQNLPCLEYIQLKRNQIGRNGLDDVLGFLDATQLTSIDISDNKISDHLFVDEVLLKMPKLTILMLNGNEFIKYVRQYRKSLINYLPLLKHIDDRPVFDEERRFAEFKNPANEYRTLRLFGMCTYAILFRAFFRGGLEEEKKQRELYKLEQEEYRKTNYFKFPQSTQNFREMIRNRQYEQLNSSQTSQITYQSLETYNTSEQNLSQIEENQNYSNKNNQYLDELE